MKTKPFPTSNIQREYYFKKLYKIITTPGKPLPTQTSWDHQIRLQHIAAPPVSGEAVLPPQMERGEDSLRSGVNPIDAQEDGFRPVLITYPFHLIQPNYSLLLAHNARNTCCAI